MLLKLVLQGLASEWQIDVELLTQKIDLTSGTVHGAISEDMEGPDLLKITKKKHLHEFNENSGTKATYSTFNSEVQMQPRTTPSPTPEQLSVSSGSFGSSGGFCRSTSGTPDQNNSSPAHTASCPSQKPVRVSIRQVAKIAAGMYLKLWPNGLASFHLTSILGFVWPPTCTCIVMICVNLH